MIEPVVDTARGWITLHAVASESVYGSYVIRFIDDAGTVVETCTFSSGCNLSLNSDDTTTRSYRVEVFGDGLVHASAAISISGTTVVDELVGELSLAAAARTIERQLLERRIEDPCDALLFTPGTHTQGSSTSDQYNDCVRSTGTWGERLRELARKYGPVIAVTLGGSFVLTSGGSPAPPPNIDRTNPAPTPDVKLTVTPEPADIERLAVRLRRQSSNQNRDREKIPGDASARYLARRTCLSYVARYLPARLGNPCEGHMIFAPGKNVQQAAEHDFEAITATPTWLRLNYSRVSVKEAQGNRRDWYKTYCTPRDPSQQCDEYPYFASRQGGSLSSPRPSVKSILSTHNQDEGNSAGYGGFIAWCKPSSDTVAGVGGSAFLVLPMPGDDAPDTLWSCGAGRWASSP